MPFQPFAHDWDRIQAPSTEQWSWLAVEIAEIRRCAAVGDQAHNRLALLLTDHLVEVIVGREVNTRLAWQPVDSLVEKLREDRDHPELPAVLAKAIDEHVGPEQRQELDQHLHEKTRYLAKQGVLTSEERQVLGWMHEYRNAAYHRDTLDADLIGDLVLAYMLLAGQLLARYRPMMWEMGTGPDELPGLLTDGLDIDLKGVAVRFSDRAAERVDVIGRAVAFARAIQHIVTDDAQKRGDPMPDDDFAHLLTTVNGVSPAQLQSWANRASSLKANIRSLVNLMLRYIGLDKELSKIEASAGRLQIIVDKMEQDYQDHLDEIRGR